MATPKSRLTFKAIFNDTVSGLFRSAAGYLIPAAAEQAVVNEMDSFVNKVDDLALYPVDTSADISLDFDAAALAWTRRFYSGTAFSVPKTVTTANDTYALHYSWSFEITDVAATTEWPDHIMSDVRFDTSTKIWTPSEIGRFKAVADWNNTAWELTIYGPYA